MKAGWIIAAAAAAAFAGPACAQAPIVGEYVVAGSCPGQAGAYRGTLTITRPDALYTLRWQLTSGQVSTARAIEQDGRLAIAYELDGGGGVMITHPTDSGWVGSWAMFNSRTTCTEVWRRR